MNTTAGYSKWDGGSIGWSFNAFGTTNGLIDGVPMYTVTAQAGDDFATMQALTTLSYTPLLDAEILTLGLGSGRYLRVRCGNRLRALRAFLTAITYPQPSFSDLCKFPVF